jgi:3-deoxy-D-manno-octulosonate 8-phosphate phosphatase (KDO 8-P phosphatase)
MNIKAAFNTIQAFVLDVDGVLTDGRVMVTEKGDEYRSMHTRDGYAIQHAVKMGYRVFVISGGRSEGVRLRLERLGVQEIHLGVQDKKSVLADLMLRYGLQRDALVYMGDDLPDLMAMPLAGLVACPADAAPEIRSLAHYHSPFAGGYGCVRDIIEQVLRLQHKWHVSDALSA